MSNDAKQALCSLRFCLCGKAKKTADSCRSLELVEKLNESESSQGFTIMEFSFKIWIQTVKEMVGWKRTSDAIRNEARRLQIRYKSDQDVQRVVLQLKSCLLQSQVLELVQNPPATRQENNFADFFEELYKKRTCVYADTACFICDRLMFPKGLVKCKLQPQTVNAIVALYPGFVPPSSSIDLCCRCYQWNQKGKLPSQSLWNKMVPDEIPEVIKVLSDVELSLISQIRPFMKIFHLAKGRGQYGIRGSVVHFAQSVEEIPTQLPLDADNAGIIIVHQKLENVDSHRKLLVRPGALRAALSWLVLNNPLYSHIQISQSGLDGASVAALSVEQAETTAMVEENMFDVSGFHPISENAKMLRGGLHQGSDILPQSSQGLQCTAMAATAIAYAAVQDIASWTSTIVDEIIIRGEAFFQQQNLVRSNETNRLPMNTEEINGTVRSVFGTLAVEITPDHDAVITGMLNRYKLPNYSPIRLNSAIQMFVNAGNNYGILTTAGYSMALIRDDDHLYYFDSHSRGPKGGVCMNGTSCVLKYRLPGAAALVSAIIHKNIQPRHTPSPKNPRDIQCFAFCITPIHAEVTGGIILANNGEVPSINENTSIGPEQLAETFVQYQSPVNPELSSCLMHTIEIREPELSEVTDSRPINFMLQRKTSKPVSSQVESKLEELSFVKYFPKGQFGKSCPRITKQTTFEYFQQRIMSATRRFADVSYLFYALCEIEEEQIKQKVNVCCSMSQEEESAEWNYNPQNVHLVLSSIRGTPSYWSTYQGSVLAMIKQLGGCTFFFTTSVDDINSFEFVNAMNKFKHGFDTPDIDPQSLSYYERKELLDECPVVAARQFNLRVTEFFNLVQQYGTEIFGYPVAAWTMRIEFQGRGSGHVHCLFFNPEAPTYKDDGFLQFLESNVSCSTATTLKDKVIKYQTHRHTSCCYKGNSTECRFNFPKQECLVTKVLSEEEANANKGRFINLKRSKEEMMINNYHPILLQALKCNIDIQAVTDEMSIAYYIAKYMSKAEPETIRTPLRDVIASAQEIPTENPRKKLLKQTREIMRKRELGSQEAAFRACRLPLHKSSHATVFVPAFKRGNRTRMVNKYTISSGNPTFCLNIIDKYKLRPQSVQFDNICLFEFVAMYQVLSKNAGNTYLDEDFVEEFVEETTTKRPKYPLLEYKGFIQQRLKNAIVKFPNFNPLTQTEDYYYSLLLLYLPFREENFTQGHDSSLLAFQHHFASLRSTTDNPLIQLEFSNELNRCIILLAEEANAAQNEDNISESLEDFFDVEDDDCDAIEFGHQPDEAFNAEDHLKQIASLSGEQKRIFLEITASVTGGQGPKRIVAMGGGGVGKSYVIKIICNHIKFLTFGDLHNPVIVAAPTGVAARAVRGTTLHKAFKLPVEKNSAVHYKPLRGQHLQNLRNSMRNLKLIIIDEFSMMSYEVFRTIHMRLQEVFKSTDLFGGISILLVGDLLQLRPVKGSWIFCKPPKFGIENHLWREFEYHELCVNHRQRNDPLLSVCNALREGNITQEHVEILLPRVIDPARPNYTQLQEEFKDALYIYPTHKLVDQHNSKRAIELRATRPVYKIQAVDTYADGSLIGKPVDPKYVPKQRKLCAGIPTTLELAIGTRVMLLRNKDVSIGLVNGSIGTIVAFHWQCLREQPRQNSSEMPSAVQIKFDDTHNSRTADGSYKISAEAVEFPGKRGHKISRSMLPLVECFACNVHKVQSLSLNQAVIDLSNKHFAKGSEYVAISRVRTLNGLAIVNFDTHRFTSNLANQQAMGEIQRLRSQAHIVPGS